jgi:flagellar motility protein MotE (MotC chaperone)
MLKRFYQLLALIALVNLFAVVGLAAYLFGSGRLNAERVDQIAGVLRGEYPATDAAAPTSQPAEADGARERSEVEIAQRAAKQEYYELISSRHRQEIDDRRALNEQLRFDTLKTLERIEADQSAFEEQRGTTLAEDEREGLQKELELFSKMDPSLAKDLLRRRKDADAVRILAGMDTNRARKIIDACGKKEDDKDWVGRIVEQIPVLEQN